MSVEVKGFCRSALDNFLLFILQCHLLIQFFQQIRVSALTTYSKFNHIDHVLEGVHLT